MIKKICINKVSLIIGILLLLLVSGLMAGCGGEKASDKEVSKKITVKDSLGREVSVPSKVERIVDLAIMDGTRVMVLLGAEDKLVGASDRVTDIMFGEDGDWYAVPKAAPQLKDLPCVGTPSEPNAEYIMSLTSLQKTMQNHPSLLQGSDLHGHNYIMAGLSMELCTSISRSSFPALKKLLEQEIVFRIQPLALRCNMVKPCRH